LSFLVLLFVVVVVVVVVVAVVVAVAVVTCWLFWKHVLSIINNNYFPYVSVHRSIRKCKLWKGANPNFDILVYFVFSLL